MSTLNREQVIDKICEELKMNETQKRTIRKVLRGYDKVRCEEFIKGNKIKEPFGTMFVKKRNTNNVFSSNSKSTMMIRTRIQYDFRDKLIENLSKSSDKDLYS